ncbi:MAG: adenine phosphoribosyltransferase [Burkholderiales bacterium]|nr:adenine phosphoribosyltransferase [Burkholderiales bacterium]
MDIKPFIRLIPDFPRPGVTYHDITTLLKDRAGFRATIDALAARFRGRPLDKVAAVEWRGFVFGAALADRLGAGFVPVRRLGKLPAQTVSREYQFEHVGERIEMQVDAVAAGEAVVVVNDVLASGESTAAAIALLRELGANVVEAAFLAEIAGTAGRRRVESLGVPVFALAAF